MGGSWAKYLSPSRVLFIMYRHVVASAHAWTNGIPEVCSRHCLSYNIIVVSLFLSSYVSFTNEVVYCLSFKSTRSLQRMRRPKMTLWDGTCITGGCFRHGLYAAYYIDIASFKKRLICVHHVYISSSIALFTMLLVCRR